MDSFLGFFPATASSSPDGACLCSILAGSYKIETFCTQIQEVDVHEKMFGIIG